MKKIVLSMAAMAALFFTACEKDEALSPETVATIEAKQSATSNTTTEEINMVEALIGAKDPNPAELGKKKKVEIDSLSPNILDYIKTNYGDFTPSKAFTDKDGNFIVIVKDAAGNVKVLLFDKDGKFVKEATTKVLGGGISAADSAALAAIKVYINEKYAGATVGGIKKDKDGTFSVTIKTADGKVVTLTFDKDGKFVKETTQTTGGGTPDPVITIIKTYLSDNYPGASIGAIVKGKDGTYTTTIKTKDGKVVSVTFDKDGKFVKETPVSNGGGSSDPTVLVTIKTYLTEHYAGATFSGINKEKDGTYTTTVKTADGKTIVVTFDKDGKFVKETVKDTPTVVTLPDAASTYIKTNYPTGKIVGPVKVDKDGNYTVVVQTDKGYVVIIFDKDGKLIKEYKKK